MKHLLLAGIAIIAMSSAARANWQYTHWGMSPEEFVRASRGAAHLVAFDPQHNRGGLPCIISGIYKSNEQTFELTARFENQTLKRVVLGMSGNATETDANKLFALLSNKYGPPRIIKPVNFWTDLKGGNEVELMYVSVINDLEIHYTPVIVGDGL